MIAEGFSPPHSIELDTKDFVRFDAPGDKAGRHNGFYKVRSGDYPAGWFGDWKTNEQHFWKYFSESELSEKEKKALNAEQRRLKNEAQVEKEAVWAERAEDARSIWDKASPDVEGHPYCERKSIEPPKGLRLHQAKDGTQLIVVPMWLFDMNGQPRLQNLQYIAPDGSKRFMKGARIDGCFFSLRGSSDHNVILLCEGVATGYTLWRATGLSVVVAFNSGNLVKVARELKLWRPMTDIVVCADDDVTAPDDWDEKGRGRPWVNVGAKSGQRAAKTVEGRLVFPKFAQGASRSRTDFNDLERVESLDVVNKQVWGCLGAGPIATDDDQGEVQATPAAEPIDESWRSKLPRTSGGALDGGNVEGVAMFIRHHRLLQGRLAFNTFSKEVEVDDAPLQKHHVAAFRRVMHQDKFKARKEDVSDEMEAEARRNQYDPLIDYLAGLKWDNEGRIDNWLTTYLGAKPTPYIAAIASRILIGAVARARRPGCKLDTMPVLEGPQGLGKSTAIRFLFGDKFFIDDLHDFTHKDSFQLIQGAWVCEIAELSAMQRSEISDVKKFLTKVQDKFRAPYAKAPEQVPRRCIFFGSVNPTPDSGYLRDSTGARRFWPILCRKVDLRGILRDRDQLWAEAVVRFEAGEHWHLDSPDLIALAEEQQHARREVHPWEDPIIEYCYGKHSVTIADLLENAIKLSVERRDVRASRTVGGILRSMGFLATTERIDGAPSKVFLNPRYTDRQVSNDKA